MRAVVCHGFGGVEVLKIDEIPEPVPGPRELLVRVQAAALNRADTLQRQGGYAAPAGESKILGIEIAGEVVSWGAEVTGFAVGERVFGIVGSGGYAELCVMDSGMAVAVPEGWSFVQAVAVPEAFCTADTTLFTLGGLVAGERVLIHAGGSGIGTACIQLAREVGARIFVTCGSEGKLARCIELGAETGVNYKTHDFVAEVLAWSEGQGVDVVEDFIGASYLKRNLSVLKPGGRLVQVGLISGSETTIDLVQVVLRRLQIKGSALRPRPLADKREIADIFRQRWLPRLIDGRMRAVIDSVYPLERVAEAHAAMEANLNFGKIVLTL